MVRTVTKNEPELVYRNALRRVSGHVRILRMMIEVKPDGPEDVVATWNEDLADLVERPFVQEACFPEHINFVYTLADGTKKAA